MDRTHLIQIVKACDHEQEKIRQSLEQYFDTKEGQAVLASAPRCMVYTVSSTGEMEGQQTSKDLVIQLLIQEVESW